MTETLDKTIWLKRIVRFSHITMVLIIVLEHSSRWSVATETSRSAAHLSVTVAVAALSRSHKGRFILPALTRTLAAKAVEAPDDVYHGIRVDAVILRVGTLYGIDGA